MIRRILWLFLFLLVVTGSAGWWAWNQWTGQGPSAREEHESVLVQIPPGMTLSAAADTLVNRGLLKRRRVLLLGAKALGLDRGLRAGLYRLEKGTSARNLLINLTSGQSVQVRVTIAEGLDSETTAEIMATALDFSAREFLAVADSLVYSMASSGKLLSGTNSPDRMDSLLAVASERGIRTFHWCEGYLAPDTYLFSTGTGPADAAHHLFDTQIARLDSALSLVHEKSTVYSGAHELLTLASIVEAEARREDERLLIAAVYSNRLRRNWRLEADPTVAYILRKRGKRMFFKDLEVDSPYNAYRNRGLPPGPIGNPGLASILAAALPAQDSKAMFFVSDGQGGHIFSRTKQEHDAAVQRYRRSRASRRR